MKLSEHDKLEILSLLDWKRALIKAIKNGSYKLRSIKPDKSTSKPSDFAPLPPPNKET